MANLEFCDTHNIVAYLLKLEGSEDFQQIVDFLNTSHIKFALPENPTIYTSVIQHFWQIASTSTLEKDGEVEITATIDGQLKTITEASLRRHLKLEDVDGISSLPNTEIFKQLALMGPKKTAWEHFSSNIATAIICLAINRTFNFSKMIFEGMEKIWTVPTPPHDSPLPRGHTPGSDEGRMQQTELMDLVIKLSDKVLALETDLQQTIWFIMKKREAAFILRIKIYRDRSKQLIGLSQNAYMDKILKRYKMDNSKCGTIPMQERLDLIKSQDAQTPKEVNRMKNVPYASAIGSIMYANPCELTDCCEKKILTYLRNTKDMFLVYDGNPSMELRVKCYCDAGFETNRDDTKSQTGYVFVLNEGAVDWKSSKQSTIAMSATESEYISASEAVMEAVWIIKFILGLGIVPTINKPLNMYCDNSAAIHYANEPGVQRGARHYHRRYHYVRECVELGKIRILKVHTDNNLADPFTKALSNRKLTQHARSMGLRHASSFM
ncbi:hypothetical protein Tco_0506437 [Tanacetum coccineum]